MKKKRLDKIIEIITAHEVETQDELITYLRAEGFDVTQATISRDIRELKLTKVMTGRGNYRYIMPELGQDVKGLHLSHALSDAITRVAYAENIVVVHTYPGMAQAVALEVDRLNHGGILGSVAGDDTIFIVTSDKHCAHTVSEEIKELIRTRAREKGDK
ncbi:MAG: arginine repressor [Ruminococcaceae bacterium]|nr:arginine repressor [Oscillospiraceae bacterium]